MEQITTDLTVIEKNQNFVQLKNGAEKAWGWADKLVVKSADDMDSANEHILNFKEGLKMAEATRRFFVDPINESVKRINAAFKPYTAKLEEAIKMTSTKMIAYHNEQEEKARKAQEAIQKKVDEGKLTIEQGAKKLEKAIEPEKTERTESGAVATFVRRKVVQIDDIDKVPRKYLVPDMQMILRDLKAGMKIPGASLVEEKSLASRRGIPF